MSEQQDDAVPEPLIPEISESHLSPMPAFQSAPHAAGESTPEPPRELPPPQVGPAPALQGPPPVPGFPLPAIPPAQPEPPLFQSYVQPPAPPTVRMPHFGHLMLLALLLVIATVGVGTLGAVALVVASHFHSAPEGLVKNAASDVRVNLLFEGVLYLITLGLCIPVFPMVWNRGYFAGLQWRGSVAFSKRWLLAATALACFGLAIVDQLAMPGPDNAPIEKMFSSPGAAWMMFAFGVTMAPFFEEMFFRGFLLPALATACDWIGEKIKHTAPRALDENGHPQWSLPAMIVASIATSLPFALMHVEQQGHSIGPFLLIVAVSLILCGVRLYTRSLAASTLVHACYNFFIFAIALAATGGFRHFDKM